MRCTSCSSCRPALDAASTLLQLANAGIQTTPLDVFAVGRVTSPPTLRLSLGAMPDEASLAACLHTVRQIVLGEHTAQPVI